jgi:predicted RNase H-like HicB family nuclease
VSNAAAKSCSVVLLPSHGKFATGEIHLAAALMLCLFTHLPLMCDITHTKQELQMAARLYPAILEKAEKKTFAVWLPDFPACVAVGRTPDEAVEKAQARLSTVIDGLAEQDCALPPPTAIGDIDKPKTFLAFVMMSVTPPDPSERVNIYLPKRLIARADARAADLGMSRSSFFGFALSMVLGASLGPVMMHAGVTARTRALKSATLVPKAKR